MSGWSRLKVVWAVLVAVAWALLMLSCIGNPNIGPGFMWTASACAAFIAAAPALPWALDSRIIAPVTATAALANLFSYVAGVDEHGLAIALFALFAGLCALTAWRAVVWVARGFMPKRSN